MGSLAYVTTSQFPSGDIVHATGTHVVVITPNTNDPTGRSVAFGGELKHLGSLEDVSGPSLEAVADNPIQTEITIYTSALKACVSAQGFWKSETLAELIPEGPAYASETKNHVSNCEPIHNGNC